MARKQAQTTEVCSLAPISFSVQRDTVLPQSVSLSLVHTEETVSVCPPLTVNPKTRRISARGPRASIVIEHSQQHGSQGAVRMTASVYQPRHHF